jgi:hypothetical protein
VTKENISLGCAIIGAVVTVATLFVRTPKLEITWMQIRKVVSALALGGATWFVFFVIGNAVFAPDSEAQDRTRTTNRSASPSTAASPLSSTDPTTTASVESIKIESPRNGQRVGREVRVSGTGTTRAGEHLWIFVYTSDQRLYYAAGPVDTLVPEFWSLGGVVLGGDVREFPEDAQETPYTIYAVVVDSKLHAAIEAKFKKDDGTVGTHAIPGGAAARKVDHVTPLRTH